MAVRPTDKQRRQIAEAAALIPSRPFTPLQPPRTLDILDLSGAITQLEQVTIPQLLTGIQTVGENLIQSAIGQLGTFVDQTLAKLNTVSVTATVARSLGKTNTGDSRA